VGKEVNKKDDPKWQKEDAIQEKTAFCHLLKGEKNGKEDWSQKIPKIFCSRWFGLNGWSKNHRVNGSTFSQGSGAG